MESGSNSCKKEINEVLEKRRQRRDEILSKYEALYSKLDTLWQVLKNSEDLQYRNTINLKKYDEEIQDLAREVDRLREFYIDEYTISEVMKRVEDTLAENVMRLRNLYGKNMAAKNWVTQSRPRSRSFPSAFKNLFTRKRGGKRGKKTRKH
jgi:uncharacterized protein YutD